MIHDSETLISEQVDQLRLRLRGAPICVQRGDIIFGYRNSAVQRVMNIWGDPMTHVGVVGAVDGELKTIELGPKGLFSRSVDQFSKAYKQLGILRPAIPRDSLGQLAAAAEQHLRTQDLDYAWSICALVEVAALVRRYVPAVSDKALRSYSQAAAAQLTNHIGPQSHTCAGFVVGCLAAACPTAAESLRWPVRARASPLRRYPSITDLEPTTTPPTLAADAPCSRLLFTPADLFVGMPAEYRVIVRNKRTTVLIDSDL